MCGIVGIYAFRDSAPPINEEELLRIRDHMIRRGPDGAGLWTSDDGRIGLGHRRLAIIDLSETGAQPMASADGRYWITFNGEIYNYRELRKELQADGRVFRSQSDTEVLLHLYADRGERMVDVLRGMYTFGIWDQVERTLFLARDPFGIKPLYYADDGKTFRFASQVKALLAGGTIDTAPEPAGTVGFLLLGSVPEPYTIYRNIRALPAGTTLRINREAVGEPRMFFDIRESLLAAQDNSTHSAQMREIFADAVGSSVRAHLVADVPVGVFLSAGIDSGAITGLAAAAGTGNLHTLTLGFDEFHGTPDDELPLASEVAKHYRTTHHQERVSRTEFEELLPDILTVMDQPSIDGVNTYLVSRAAARNGMKVALSGLGGDELLGGYPSFHQVPRLVHALAWSNHLGGLGRMTASAVRALTGRWLGRITSPKYAGVLEYGASYGGAYLLRRGLFMPWELTQLHELLDPATIRSGLNQLDLISRLNLTTTGIRSPHAKVVALETAWYMRNQLLRDADWAGMAHSLEIRVPLVDVSLFRSVAPFVVSETHPIKQDLARVPVKRLPDALTKRAKTGFSTPVGKWIDLDNATNSRGLRGWALRVLPPQPKLIRVLALVTDAFGGHGGIAKFNRDLLAALAAMPECGEVVGLPRVISRSVENVPERVRFVVASARGKLRYVLALVRALWDGPYDLLINGHINLATLAAFATKRLAVPSLLVVHGVDAWTPHRRAAVRHSLAAVERIVGVSQLTLDRLNTWATIDHTRQRVLPNCVDLTQFSPGPKPADLVAQHQLADRTVLMTFGRLASEERFKGFDEILEVLPALVQEIPNVTYLICGDGQDRARLEAKAAQLGMSDRVQFTGFVPEDRKADYFRLADAYVMPSRGEGFGIVYLEALACGVPVVGSSVDGSREALLDGELGELVDPAQADQIRAGVIRALRRARGVPKRLATFSSDAFRVRLNAIVREVLLADPARLGGPFPVIPPLMEMEADCDAASALTGTKT